MYSCCLLPPFLVHYFLSCVRRNNPAGIIQFLQFSWFILISSVFFDAPCLGAAFQLSWVNIISASWGSCLNVFIWFTVQSWNERLDSLPIPCWPVCVCCLCYLLTLRSDNSLLFSWVHLPSCSTSLFCTRNSVLGFLPLINLKYSPLLWFERILFGSPLLTLQTMKSLTFAVICDSVPRKWILKW